MDQLSRTRSAAPTPAPPGIGRGKRRHRVRRAIAMALFVVMVPVTWSYAGALTAPGNAPFSARTVEWIKSHGGRGAVLDAERFWYSWHKPPVGGTPPGGIPIEAAPSLAQPAGSTQSRLPDHLAAPQDVQPFVPNPLPSEGRWQTVGRTVDGLPTLRVTYLRPDSLHTSLLAGVMWMDTKLLHAELIPGTVVPGRSWPTNAEVPPSRYDQIAATFNSGFLLADSHGGFYLDGRTAAPLVPGQASLVIYKDGTVNVGSWGSDVSMTPDVVAVRQNLSMLVSNGRPLPGLATDSVRKWGVTLGNAVLVWRSGIGVTQDGALVYAAGPGLTVQSLAAILARAGAVRAMELDINTEWTSANYYTSRKGSAPAPHKLLADMYQGPDRYLIPDQRDFFAMFLPKRSAASG
ncbi:MAG: phosphodiester glycosidase family protein [Actinobacteria bacterium]|nr:phosphodiester glycosidase family protein [Actinomycetota bacterium]